MSDNIVNINDAARRQAQHQEDEEGRVLGQLAVTQPFKDGSIGLLFRTLEGTWAYVHTETRSLAEPPVLQEIPDWSAREWCEKIEMPLNLIDAWFGGSE